MSKSRRLASSAKLSTTSKDKALAPKNLSCLVSSVMTWFDQRITFMQPLRNKRNPVEMRILIPKRNEPLVLIDMTFPLHPKLRLV